MNVKPRESLQMVAGSELIIVQSYMCKSVHAL